MRVMHILASLAVLMGAVLVATPAEGVVPLPQGGGRGPRPIPPMGWSYQWVPPVYQTVTDRAWVEERRDWTSEWVEVRPGRWEQVWRQTVVPGHWDWTTRQVMVAAGYWQLVRASPPVVVVPTPRP